MFHAACGNPENRAESEETLILLDSLHEKLCTRTQAPTQTLRDLTSLANWSVSTAKAGNGVEQLLDGDAKTYWQSDSQHDGQQPHTIVAQFMFKVKIAEIGLYLDYQADESYTPAIVTVRAGNSYNDLKVVRRCRKLNDPRGWVCIPMGDIVDEYDEWSEEESDGEDMGDDQVARERRNGERRRRRRERMEERRRKAGDACVTKAFMLQIIIHCNHQNGRDSHVRMVRVLGAPSQTGENVRFSSTEYRKYECIR